MLVLKVVFSVLIVVALSEHSRHIPLIYKASFLLTMTAVLFMPYMNNDLGYGITNFGAFFFKIMVMLIAFNYCLRFPHFARARVRADAHRVVARLFLAFLGSTPIRRWRPRSLICWASFRC